MSDKLVKHDCPNGHLRHDVIAGVLGCWTLGYLQLAGLRVRVHLSLNFSRPC